MGLDGDTAPNNGTEDRDPVIERGEMDLETDGVPIYPTGVARKLGREILGKGVGLVADAAEVLHEGLQDLADRIDPGADGPEPPMAA